MISIIVLIVVLMIMLAICMMSFQRFLLTPQFGLIISFLFALFGCLANAKRWELQFSDLTIAVVLIGFAAILSASLFFQYFYRLNKNLDIVVNEKRADIVVVNEAGIRIWTVVQIINLILVAQFLKTQTGSATLQFAINAYRNAIFLTQDVVALPLVTRITRSMCIYSGYMFLYLLIYNIVFKIKTSLNKYYMINIICATVTSLLIGGSRGNLLQYLVAGLTIYFALFTFKNNRAFSVKQVIGVLLVMGVFLLLFGQMSEWLGRGEVDNLSDTIFTYLSGGMVNLDSYLERAVLYSSDKNFTFTELINTYYRITGQNQLQYRGLLANIYMTKNGFSTGNIYTMFASYYHDGKILGVFFFSFLMALIGQWLLKLTIVKYESGKINIPMIIYGYMYFDFLQCNFSNRFYSQFFADNMIKFIIFLLIFRFFLTTNVVKVKVSRF